MAGEVWSALVRDGTTDEKVRIVDAQGFQDSATRAGVNKPVTWGVGERQ